MKNKSKPKWIKDIAQQRINQLMQQAEENKLTHPERSRRYCELATKISQKYKIKLVKYKHKFCKNCYNYYTSNTMKKRKIPKTSLFQTTCLHCGKKTKIGIMQKAAKTRNKQKIIKQNSKKASLRI